MTIILLCCFFISLHTQFFLMLRKATPNDLSYIYELYMHPLINPWLLYEPMEPETFRPIYFDLLEKGIQYVYGAEGIRTGMCKLAPLTWRSAHVIYLGGVGIHPSYAGRGHGPQLMNEIIQYSRESGYKRIELSVAVSNDAAIHLYKKAGFEKEGVLRNYTFLKNENKYLDEIIMSYLL